MIPAAFFSYLRNKYSKKEGEQKMTIEDKQLEFIIYCVESTAERLGCYGSEVYNKLKELGAINDYIRSYYDTLHTQGKAYIVDSLLEYIYHRDPQWLPEGYKPFFPAESKTGGALC